MRHRAERHRGLLDRDEARGVGTCRGVVCRRITTKRDELGADLRQEDRVAGGPVAREERDPRDTARPAGARDPERAAANRHGLPRQPSGDRLGDLLLVRGSAREQRRVGRTDGSRRAEGGPRRSGGRDHGEQQQADAHALRIGTRVGLLDAYW